MESQRDSCSRLTLQSPGAASAGPSAWCGNPGLGEAPLANWNTPARPQARGLGIAGAVPPPLTFSCHPPCPSLPGGPIPDAGPSPHLLSCGEVPCGRKG